MEIFNLLKLNIHLDILLSLFIFSHNGTVALNSSELSI